MRPPTMDWLKPYTFIIILNSAPISQELRFWERKLIDHYHDVKKKILERAGPDQAILNKFLIKETHKMFNIKALAER